MKRWIKWILAHRLSLDGNSFKCLQLATRVQPISFTMTSLGTYSRVNYIWQRRTLLFLQGEATKPGNTLFVRPLRLVHRNFEKNSKEQPLQQLTSRQASQLKSRSCRQLIMSCGPCKGHLKKMKCVSL